jgi:hypothetical protein
MAGKISSKIKTRAQENTVGVIAGLVVLLVVLLVAVISLRIISSNKGDGGDKVETAQEIKNFRLSEDAQSNSVTIYVERGVTADENHYSIEMTVSADNRTIRVLKGYQNIEDRSEGLPNNIEAYTTFLKALERYEFTAWREGKSGYGFREACPTQKSYRFILNDQAYEQFNRWYTFCNGTRFGDYGGKVNSVYTLFKNQFPNYSDVTRGVKL